MNKNSLISFKSIKQIFPGILFWLRLPALTSWIAVSAGILTAHNIHFMSLSHKFYLLLITFAITSLFVGLITENVLLRFCSFLAVSFIWCTIRTDEQTKMYSQFTSTQPVCGYIRGYLITNPAPVKNGYRFLIKCKDVSFDTSGLLKNKTVRCQSTCTPPNNCHLILFGRCCKPQKPQHIYEYDEYTNLVANGIAFKMEVDSVQKLAAPKSIWFTLTSSLRLRVLSVLDRFNNSSHRGVMRAAFLNETEYLDDEVKNCYRKSGIYHLLSISGLHAAMIISATYVFLSITPLSALYRHITVILVLWFYQLFIGFIPSLFRATVMATLIILSLLFQKKNYALQTLGIAGTIWLLFSPESLFTPGYQLSFAATFGIIAFNPVLSSLQPRISNPALEFLFKAFYSAMGISIASFLCTAPILLYHFGTLSLYGFIANLFAVPLMGYCMWSFFLSLLFEPIPIIVYCTTTFSSLMLDAVKRVAQSADNFTWSQISMSVPYPEIVVLFIILLISIVTIERKHLLKLLRWALPVFLLVLPAIILIRDINKKIQINRFYNRQVSVTAVIWPHHGLWLFCEGSLTGARNIYTYTIRNWLRFNHRGFLEKVILWSPDQRKALQIIEPPDFDSLSHRVVTRQICSWLCSAKSAEQTQIKFSVEKQWVICNTNDSTIKTGFFNNNDTITLEIPASIRIYH